jgi:opacity protein-like surface antigen
MEKVETTAVGSIKAGYDLNDYVGAEVRYGGVNSRSSDIELNSFTSIYAIAPLPISESFSVYGLAGATSANLPGIALDLTKGSEASASFGVGVRYAITDCLGLSLEATRISSHDAYKLDAVMLGIDYKF